MVDGGQGRRPVGTLRALRYRNYRLFFSGQLISLIGTWMQSVAQSWLVYRLTGSAALLGLIGFSSQLPVFVLATLGGAVADRGQRRNILLCTQCASMVLALLLAVMTLAGWIQVWHIFLLSSLLGCVNAFDIPARQAFVVEMVGRDDLVNAIALNSSIFNGARIIGPAIAGTLVATIGEGWCFFLNAVSYLAVIANLNAMQISSRPRTPRAASVPATIVEGFRYVWQNRPIRLLLVLLGLVSFMGMPYVVLMPIFADQILHHGARGLGLLIGATGVGAIAGALVLAARPGIAGLGRWIVCGAAGFGLSLVLFSLSRSFWLSLVLLLPSGFCQTVQMASSNTLIQSMVPDAIRGRVMALYSMMFMGMAPFGALFAGLLAHYIGAPAVVMLGGIICIAGALVFGWRLYRLRGQVRRMISSHADNQLHQDGKNSLGSRRISSL